tara:strand:- start:347 stop:922 length:576 start_codon:yes stop_codon:yes gene_type:complete
MGKRKATESQKRISTTLISEMMMTPEQRAKFSLTPEAIDLKGYVRRLKVTDQNIFDVLFIEYLIEQPQHEAACLFMEDVYKSGACIASPSLDGDQVRQPMGATANRIAEKRMTFSAPYRFMLGKCGEEQSSWVMKFIEVAHVFPRTGDDRQDYAKQVADLIRSPLIALSKFYGTSGKRDPRRIIASQMMRR